MQRSLLNPIGTDVASADRLEFGRTMDVEADQVAAEASHDPREDPADLARANYGHGPSGKIEAHQSIKREVALARPIVGTRNPAVESEQQADSEFGYGIRRIFRHAGDPDAEVLRRPHVDVVDPGGAGRDEPGAAIGEVLQRSNIDDVVDEYTDRRETRCQGGRFRVRAASRMRVDTRGAAELPMPLSS